MASAALSPENPFADPSVSFEERTRDHSFALDSTLSVGHNASLTLGQDSLIALDENFEKRDASNCCGLLPFGTGKTRAIPLYNILWAELSGSELVIDYASPYKKVRVQPATLKYQIEPSALEQARSFSDRLLDRAYGSAQRNKSARVLVNPHSGKGSAEKWYYRDVEPLLKASRCVFDMVRTKCQGDAVEVARNLPIGNYDTIICCSGDGLPHEVFNGLGKRSDARKALARLAVCMVPCGSGNAMSHNLNGTESPSLATLAIAKGIRTPMDLMSVTRGGTRLLSFLSQALGLVADVDLGTDNIRWMGSARFTYGFLVRVIRKTIYPCDIAIKTAIEGKQAIREHYRREVDNRKPAGERREYRDLPEDDASESSGEGEGLPALRYGTVNDKLPEGWELVPYDKLGTFFCGNMATVAADTTFFSAALPNDGHMDLVCADGDISRAAALNMLLSVETGKFFDDPLVKYRKILGYRIIPKQNAGYISVDGERVPFQPFQTEVHKGLATVLSKTGHVYEAKGPL